MASTALQTSIRAEDVKKLPVSKGTAKSLSNASQFELKSKWMATFEQFLMGQDPSDACPHFWDDLFLLKIHKEFLLQQLCLKSSAGLISHWRIWSNVLAHCVEALADDEIRQKHALETLYLLLSGIIHHRFSNWAVDVSIIMAGKENGAIERFLRRLLDSIAKLVCGEQEDVRRISIHIILALVTANNSMEDNFIISFVLEAGLAPILFQIVLEPPAGITRRDALTVITMLSILSEISVGRPLDGPSMSKTNEKKEIDNSFAQLLRKCEAGPFLKHTVMVLEHDIRVALRHRGSTPYIEQSFGQISIISTLSEWLRSYYSPTESALIDAMELRNAQLSPSECFLSNPGLSFLIFHLLVQHNEFFLKSLFFPTTLDMGNPVSSRKLPNAIIPPALVDFLELSSFFLPSTEPKGLVHARLILTTLLIIVENNELCFLLHDDKLMTKVKFLGDRKRKDRIDRVLPSHDLPLAFFVIEVCHIFLRYHISADLFVGGELPWLCEVYSFCLDILHRVICFQKKVHIRLQYPWKGLWTTLMTFLTSFCASILARSSEDLTSLRNNVIPVIRKVLGIFNIGITFGDHFLPTPSDYDDLYYEIIRCERQFRTIISSIHEIELRAQGTQISTSEASEGASSSAPNDPSQNSIGNIPVPHDTPSASLDSELFNIISILDYFSEKLGHFQVANPEAQLSGPLVINMIKSNYENLRLKLQDDIDQYEKYDGSKISEQKMLRRYAKILVQDLKLKRYTEIEAAISQRVPTKLAPPSPSHRVVNLQ